MQAMDISTGKLSKEQEAAADPFRNSSVFLYGPAAAGKTTAAISRLSKLLDSAPQVQGNQVLVLLPQKSLAKPYLSWMSANKKAADSNVSIQTMSSIVRRMVALFWPLIGSFQLFEHPYEQPRFLTLESAQYYMAKIVDPMIDQGRFNNVTLPRFRLYSQIIDNLNKSALVGFSHTEIGKRLSSAWIGDQNRANVFSDVQEAVNQFRSLCLRENLLDLSLQVELFKNYLWPNQTFQRYFSNQYRHLIYDNSEEDPPYVHDIVRQWLPALETALIIHDTNAGYRSFLGADPQSSLSLAEHTETSIELKSNYVSSADLLRLGKCLNDVQNCSPDKKLIQNTLWFSDRKIRYFPELLTELSDQVNKLIQKNGVDPSEIAILAPFVSDSLIYSLSHELEQAGIKASVQKPSSSLMQDPFIKTLVTLAKFSRPSLGFRVEYHITAVTLSQSIQDLDLIRAHLLLGKFDPKNIHLYALPEAKKLDDRISDNLLERYRTLNSWLEDADENEPLDSFFSRLFGEVLSQPGFGMHDDLQAGKSTAILMESYRKFYQSLSQSQRSDQASAAQAFIESLDSGLISAMYLSDWDSSDPDSILIAPVMSFLMQNKAVKYQFWINIGSKGWYERLEQPLTHPVVLSRSWQSGDQWTADDEFEYNQTNLKRILSGLLARCRTKIFVLSSDFNESGIEERGQLLTLLQTLHRKAIRKSDGG